MGRKVSTNPTLIRQWLQSLGVLVATGMSVTDAKERLATFAPLLASEFDARFFCQRSLAFVAKQCKFFPTFSEICEHLHEFGADLRTSQLLLAGPDRSETAWKSRIESERSDAVRDWSDPYKVRSSMQLVLSSDVEQFRLGHMLAGLVKRHAPQNLGLLPPDWIEDKSS
jgi:hypothetical protein